MGWYQAKFVPNVFKNRSTQEDIYIFSLTISTTCGSNKYKRIIPSLNALTATNVFKGTQKCRSRDLILNKYLFYPMSLSFDDATQIEMFKIKCIIEILARVQCK